MFDYFCILSRLFLEKNYCLKYSCEYLSSFSFLLKFFIYFFFSAFYFFIRFRRYFRRFRHFRSKK